MAFFQPSPNDLIEFNIEYRIVSEISVDNMDGYTPNIIVFYSDGSYTRTEDIKHTKFKNKRKVRFKVMITDMRGEWQIINNELYLNDLEVYDYYCTNSLDEIKECNIEQVDMQFGKNEFIKDSKAYILDSSIVVYN